MHWAILSHYTEEPAIPLTADGLCDRVMTGVDCASARVPWQEPSSEFDVGLPPRAGFRRRHFLVGTTMKLRANRSEGAVVAEEGLEPPTRGL